MPMVPAVAHKANRVFVVHEPTRDPGEPAIVVDEVHNLVDREGILEVIAGDGIRNRGRIIRSPKFTWNPSDPNCTPRKCSTGLAPTARIMPAPRNLAYHASVNLMNRSMHS